MADKVLVLGGSYFVGRKLVEYLAGHGYDVYNFSGGFRFYDAVMNDRRLHEAAYPCGLDR